MTAPAILESRNYFSRFGLLAWLSLAQLVRAPSHSRRAEAARRAARHVLLLASVIGIAIIALMYMRYSSRQASTGANPVARCALR